MGSLDSNGSDIVSSYIADSDVAGSSYGAAYSSTGSEAYYSSEIDSLVYGSYDVSSIGSLS